MDTDVERPGRATADGAGPVPAGSAPDGSPDPSPRRDAWRWFAVGAAAAIAAHLLLPLLGLPAQVVRAAMYTGLVAAAAGGVAAGVRLNRPPDRAAWWLILAGMSASFAADMVVGIRRDLLDSTGFPSMADALYLVAYPLAVAGLVRLTRGYSRGTDRAGMLDALILIASLTLVTWSYVIQPRISVPEPLTTRLVLVAYPIANLVMGSVVIRLAVGPGRRPPTFWLLVAGLGALVATDTAYGYIELVGDYGVNNPVDAGWMVWYACWAVAALHPSARAVGSPAAMPTPGLTTGRIVVLVGAALLTPSLLAVQALLGRPIQLPVLVVGALVLLVTVSARIRGLAEEVSAQAAARRALLGQAVRAGEEERVRVAAELHDGPIQRLASLSYTIEVARRRLARGDAPSPADVLSTLGETLVDEVTALRELMADLRPPVLDQDGLPAALRQLAAGFQERTGIDCATDVAPIGGLDAAQETVLYRVAQEAMANVAKHAGASGVLLRLTGEAAGARLEIRDDGVGFDTDVAAKLVASHHYGLASMRERVEMAGGAWLLRSRAGGGTTIVATLPATACQSGLAIG